MAAAANIGFSVMLSGMNNNPAATGIPKVL